MKRRYYVSSETFSDIFRSVIVQFQSKVNRKESHKEFVYLEILVEQGPGLGLQLLPVSVLGAPEDVAGGVLGDHLAPCKTDRI